MVSFREGAFAHSPALDGEATSPRSRNGSCSRLRRYQNTVSTPRRRASVGLPAGVRTALESGRRIGRLHRRAAQRLHRDAPAHLRSPRSATCWMATRTRGGRDAGGRVAEAGPLGRRGRRRRGPPRRPRVRPRSRPGRPPHARARRRRTRPRDTGRTRRQRAEIARATRPRRRRSRRAGAAADRLGAAAGEAIARLDQLGCGFGGGRAHPSHERCRRRVRAKDELPVGLDDGRLDVREGNEATSERGPRRRTPSEPTDVSCCRRRRRARSQKRQAASETPGTSPVDDGRPARERARAELAKHPGRACEGDEAVTRRETERPSATDRSPGPGASCRPLRRPRPRARRRGRRPRSRCTRLPSKVRSTQPDRMVRRGANDRVAERVRPPGRADACTRRRRSRDRGAPERQARRAEADEPGKSHVSVHRGRRARSRPAAAAMPSVPEDVRAAQKHHVDRLRGRSLLKRSPRPPGGYPVRRPAVQGHCDEVDRVALQAAKDDVQPAALEHPLEPVIAVLPPDRAPCASRESRRP